VAASVLPLSPFVPAEEASVRLNLIPSDNPLYYPGPAGPAATHPVMISDQESVAAPAAAGGRRRREAELDRERRPGPRSVAGCAAL
jgi:hypothetical protein